MNTLVNRALNFIAFGIMKSLLLPIFKRYSSTKVEATRLKRNCVWDGKREEKGIQKRIRGRERDHSSLWVTNTVVYMLFSKQIEPLVTLFACFDSCPCQNHYSVSLCCRLAIMQKKNIIPENKVNQESRNPLFPQIERVNSFAWSAIRKGSSVA